MKKPILFTILFVIGLSSFGQNWQLFPLDSLRWYVNHSQSDTFIQGIDYRDHRTAGADTIIELGAFARIDTTNGRHWGAQYIHLKSGNSNMGNHVIVSQEATSLVFTESYDGQIGKDTLIIKHNRELLHSWLVVANQYIRIVAKNASILPNQTLKGDSLWNISLSVENKIDGSNKIFGLLISKFRGILIAPSFYDVLRNPTGISQMENCEFFPYTEMSSVEFFRPIIGTEFHFEQFVTRQKLVHRKQTVVGYEDGRIIYKGSEAGELAYYTEPSPYHPVTYFRGYKPYSRDDETFSWTLRLNTNLFNPIPGRIEIDTFYYTAPWFGVIPRYRVMCNRLVEIFDSRNFEVWWTHGDTTFLGDSPFFTRSVMQGVGEIKHFSRTNGKWGGWVDQLDWKYIRIPNQCEIGEDQWRLTNVSNQAISKISVYPNPATNFIATNQSEPVQGVRAIQMDGRIIPLTHDRQTIDVRNLEPGFYILSIQLPGEVQNTKIQIISE